MALNRVRRSVRVWYRALQIFLPRIMPLFHFRVVGKEEVPITEGVILAANHVSYVDPLFIGVAFVERQLHFLAKEELFRSPLFGSLIRGLHAFPVRRGQGDRGAIRQCLRLLAEGGIGFLAARSGCPVVPVYVQGTDHVLPRGKRIPRLRPVTVYFGRPLRLAAENNRKESRWSYRQLSEQVMKEIGALRVRAHSSAS